MPSVMQCFQGFQVGKFQKGEKVADSLLDLDSGDPKIFEISPDWKVATKHKKESVGSFAIEKGTIHYVLFARDPVDFFTMTITDLQTRLYELLIFWSDQGGRAKRFWLPNFADKFNPVDIDPSGFYVDIEKQSFLYLHDKTRIFIRIDGDNGDRITRKISSIEQLALVTRINFIQALPSGIDVEDIVFFSTIHLVRFDSDTIEVEYKTDTIAEATVVFRELLLEYDTWD